MAKQINVIKTYDTNGNALCFPMDVPKFVVDEKSFSELVQNQWDAFHLYDLESTYTNRRNSLEKVLSNKGITFAEAADNEEADVLKAYASFKKATSDLEAFQKDLKVRYESGRPEKVSDLAVKTYVWAMTESKLELPSANKNAFTGRCIVYNNKYLGSNTWSNDRKNDFNELKDLAIKCINDIFDFTNDTTSMYKTIPCGDNLPSKTLETTINTIYGGYKANKAGGVHVQHLDSNKGLQVLILGFLKWQGCDTKTKKVASVSAFDI